MPRPAAVNDLSSAPLADYFFISGIESSQIAFNKRISNGIPISPIQGDTIDEYQNINGNQETPTSQKRTSAHTNGENRFSYEARKSAGSVIGFKAPPSNRSSATIRPVQENGESQEELSFEQALQKFTSERDTFLDEIKFSAGLSAQPNRPRPRPRTIRITNDENRTARGGSLRRRLSTMSSMMRQSTITRQASVRTSKRLSGYNSVLPAPQKFHPSPDMHPLKRPIEPVLLDHYPPRDKILESKRGYPFPDYVPMFTFPNDVNVVSSDERPRSTWHGFAMTNSDNSRLYGICLIIWMPLNHDVSDILERECEEWRKKNMSAEDREFANSLGERLAKERAKLSELLAELSMTPSGTVERETKEDEIGAIEEKIQLMNDLLQPVRLGAASRIPGLTDGDSGFWIPRAYGVLGRDPSMTGFWKEWLRAVVIPMTNGAILRVPPSSPKVGLWQPLERYVINLCAEAITPISSITQVELAVRELRLYARKEAVNEIPGSRNTDLYPLFRCLAIADIIILFEYVLAESRIILLSSHTSMLHLVSAAIVQLLYPLKWAGVFIPVLPARLIQALEAPCPYIVGIERRYEGVELPEDDFVLVDLDQGGIEATEPPIYLPRQIRRKLQSILQLAAPHHNRYGVPLGPPKYCMDAFPFDAFSTENPSIFKHQATTSSLSKLANLSSTGFGLTTNESDRRAPLFNVFYEAQPGSDRPSTASTTKTRSAHSPPSSPAILPHHTPSSRTDSGYALQSSLREKRSGVFDHSLRRTSSFGLDRMQANRRSNMPFPGHASATSVSTIGLDSYMQSTYAPSVYAQSSLAASTIMPGMLMQTVQNTDTTQWCEGHCLQWRAGDSKAPCSICEDRSDEGMYKCSACGMHSHSRCLNQVSLVCPAAFHPDQVMAAFVRCFTSLFYTYKKFLSPAAGEQKKSGLLYHFNVNGFLRSLPHENATYAAMLRDTQAFNEFIHERETTPSDQPAIKLFDELILCKRNRGRQSFWGKSSLNFLSNTTDHLWRSASATTHNSKTSPGDMKLVVGRIPAKLDPALMKEPRVVQGIPRNLGNKARRKPVPSMLGVPGFAGVPGLNGEPMSPTA